MHVLDVVILRQDDDSMKTQDDVRRKSYNAPTLEDKFDKSQMPKPMQVREVFAWIICLPYFMVGVTHHTSSALSNWLAGKVRHGQIANCDHGFCCCRWPEATVSQRSTVCVLVCICALAFYCGICCVCPFVRSRTSGALGRQSGRTWLTKIRRSGTRRGHKRRSKGHRI